MKPIRCYKIFKRTQKGLTSVVATPRFIYSETEENNAPSALRKIGYDLLVFKKKKDAIAYYNSPNNVEGEELWECSAILRKVRVPAMAFMNIYSIKEMVERLSEGLYFRFTWPQGTYMATDLRLVRKLDAKTE